MVKVSKMGTYFISIHFVISALFSIKLEIGFVKRKTRLYTVVFANFLVVQFIFHIREHEILHFLPT
jgi:hypothetical protein